MWHQEEAPALQILFCETHDVYTHGFPHALRRLGHRVDVWPGLKWPETLTRYLKTSPPDLILTMGWTQTHTDVALLRAIREFCASRDAMHVYWSTEDPIHTQVWTLTYLQEVRPDAVLTLSPRTVPYLRELGFPAEEMPFATDPTSHQWRGGGEPADIVFVGTPHTAFSGAVRPAAFECLIRPLVQRSWTVHLYGVPWHNRGAMGFEVPLAWCREPVPYEAIAPIYSAASVILCPQNDPDQLTGRTFEALGTGGGVLLTLRTPGVKRFFRDGEHLLCTSSPEETIRVLSTYLPDARARRAISQSGRREVLSRHQYEHRAIRLLEWVERWRAEKRRRGWVSAPSAVRRSILRPKSPPQADSPEGTLALSFGVPAAPEGCRLKEARLRCFADAVRGVGTTVCLERKGGLMCDATIVTAHPSRRYPYEESWSSWRVTEALEESAGRTLQLELRTEGSLGVEWARPGGLPSGDMIRHHYHAFWPRLELVWESDGQTPFRPFDL